MSDAKVDAVAYQPPEVVRELRVDDDDPAKKPGEPFHEPKVTHADLTNLRLLRGAAGMARSALAIYKARMVPVRKGEPIPADARALFAEAVEYVEAAKALVKAIEAL